MKTGYILVTPARNEENSIRDTIESVVNQTVIPSKWAIVSDASTDRTDVIIKAYAERYDWIKYLRKSSRREKGFASKVESFNMGLQSIISEEYSFIGNLDADIAIDSDYFERVINAFINNSKLGICGGRVFERRNNSLRNRKSSITSVAGAVQLFRKKCYEQIGGYLPLRYGGIDSAAEITARSKGWDVQTIADLQVIHNGPVTTGCDMVLKRKFRQGIIHYQLGYNPVFEIVRQFYRCTEYPFLLGSVSRLLGFGWAFINRLDYVLDGEVIKYFRKEQMQRLKDMLVLLKRTKTENFK